MFPVENFKNCEGSLFTFKLKSCVEVKTKITWDDFKYLDDPYRLKPHLNLQSRLSYFKDLKNICYL